MSAGILSRQLLRVACWAVLVLPHLPNMSSTINAVADKAEIIATEHHEMMSTDKGGDIPDKGIPVGDSEKRRLSRRISIHLIPMLAIVYSFSVIDRVNIGQVCLYHPAL